MKEVLTKLNLCVLSTALIFSGTCAFGIENMQETVTQPEQKQTAQNIQEYQTNYKLKVMTIDDCIKTALDNSPVIKKSRLNYNIASKQVTLAKSEYFPTIGAGTGYNLQYLKNKNYSDTNNNFNAEASLNQLIWDFGKTHANVKMQKFNKITSRFNFDKTVLDTIFTVKTKYFAMLAAKANVSVAKANVEINERNYHRIKAYFDEGIKSKIDLVNAEVYLTDAKVSLVSAEKTYKNTIIQLNNAMYLAYNPALNFTDTEDFAQLSAKVPVTLIEKPEHRDISASPDDIDNAMLISKVEKVNIITNYKFKPFPYSLEECLALADKNRPDLNAYSSTLEAIKAQLLLQKRNFYPTLTSNVGYGYNNNAQSNSLSAGVNLNFATNILKEKVKIDSAKMQVDVAQNELDLAKQNVYFEIQDAYVEMVDLEKQIPLQAAKVQHTLENLELADGRYAVGLGDYIELQDAKENYNNAQQTFILTVFNYNVAKANLEKAIALEQPITLKIEDKK